MNSSCGSRTDTVGTCWSAVETWFSSSPVQSAKFLPFANLRLQHEPRWTRQQQQRQGHEMLQQESIPSAAH